jgi:hypothetical protein
VISLNQRKNQADTVIWRKEQLMSIEVSHETEARITDEARRQGVSVDALLERLMTERAAAAAPVAGRNGAAPKLPRLHLGAMGSLHRRDLYDDVG